MLLCAGGVYEYTLENVSKTAAPSLEKRTAKLAAAVAARAEEMRSRHAGMTFTPPPGEQCAVAVFSRQAQQQTLKGRTCHAASCMS
jgi:hypothetical protein